MPADQADVLARVIKSVSEVLKVPESEIKPEHTFVADLGAKSMQSLELMAAFEEEFDIEMDDEDALKVQTVGDAATFIAGYL